MNQKAEVITIFIIPAIVVFLIYNYLNPASFFEKIISIILLPIIYIIILIVEIKIWD